MPLIEKAAAKAFGSFEAIVSGQTHEGLALLTGAPCEGMRFRGGAPAGPSDPSSCSADLMVASPLVDHDVIWARLLSYHQANYPIGASCHPDGVMEEASAHAMGLLSAHAYSILDVRDTASLRLVKLRNPWGKGSWRGEWSDGSPVWSQELLESLGHLPYSDEGVFWMEYGDLSRYFSHLDVCKLRPTWLSTRLETSLPYRGGGDWRWFR